MRTALFVAFLSLFPALGLQDPQPAPKPATPPPDAVPLVPVEEPRVRPALRDDLLQRDDAPDPLEGTWRLKTRVREGAVASQPGEGWMFVGRRHLSIHLQGPGRSEEFPMLRAGVRRWQRQGGSLQMTVVAGHFNDESGDIKVESAGATETRRFEMIGPLLRIHQGSNSWLDFLRVE
ncbi:MAG: hypothetical protein RIT25_45 [Planctomycetota bacterium]